MKRQIGILLAVSLLLCSIALAETTVDTNWVGELSYDPEERMVYILSKRVTQTYGIVKIDIDSWIEAGMWDNNSSSSIIEYDFTKNDYEQLQYHTNSDWTVLSNSDVATAQLSSDLNNINFNPVVGVTNIREALQDNEVRIDNSRL